MTKEMYLKMTKPFREHPDMARSLHNWNRIFTAGVFAGYVLILLWLFFHRSEGLLRAILIPMDGFIMVSVMRILIRRPRPYEKFGVAPVIPKETKGKSFPSRHVFSAAVIAMSLMSVPEVFVCGVVFLVVAIAVAVVRVLSGVHYISDVIAGFAFAAVCVLALYPLF
jgi:membrane-associated phospholipid phosphatase